jgi:penicillin-binding protein 2
MNRRRMTSRVRIQVLGLLMMMGMGALALKLWWIQVAHGSEWTAQLRGSSQATVRIPSVRGEIKDRNGVSLVQNRASYEVDFYLPEMVKGYRERFGSPPLTEYRATISGMPKDLKEPDIIKIVNSGVVPRLNELDLARDYNAGRLQRHYRNNTEVPYSYVKDIDFPTLAKFSEHDVGLPGVELAIKPVRSYVYGSLAAHLLGYVGMPDDVDKEEARKFTFYQQDVEGKSNIEKTMDEYLRGKPGVRYLRKNAKGTIEGVLREDPPKQGADVFLTIDARIQAITEEALRSVARGAAVVVDPSNGDILAMASVPSFDPNLFIPSIKAKDWKALQKDEGDPLVNRAVSAFPPGSTYKLITSLAGLRRGLAKQKFTCYGGVQYGDHYFQCWAAEKHYTHGTLSLSDAIKVSCNAFFYQYGNAAGIDSIDRVGELLGLGKPSGLNLTGEQPGILPGPDWMRIHYPQERWTQAYTANVSIGQGYVLTTPLQMAMAYATIANGGISYYPRLVKKVLNQDGTPVLDENGKIAVPDEPKMHADFRPEVSPADLEMERRGFWKVVNEGGGTGGRARMSNVQVAGKTGSAQASDRGREGIIAWFVCWAPFEQPKYTIAVMVEAGEHGGHGGSVAAPIAARILEHIVAMDEGKFEAKVAWTEPARKANPFQTVKEVSFHDSGPTAGNTDEEGSGDGQNVSSQMASSDASPDVEPEADSQGRVRRRGGAPVARAVPAPAPAGRNFFQRLFGIRPKPAPAPAPPPPNRKRGTTR